MRNTLWLVAAVLLALGSVGCSNSPSATPSAPPSVTSRPVTPTPRPEPTFAPVPPLSTAVVVPTPAPTPVPTGPLVGGPCSNRYAFVTDVSIPDGTAMTPGQVFTKTWRVRNEGTCTWGDGYTLGFSKGHSMTAVTSVPIPRTAPGATADVSVLLTAPTTPGAYEGHWSLRNPEGVSLTPSLWIKITVP